MAQTKKQSLTEAVVNTVVGLSIAFVCQLTIARLNGIELSAADNFTLTFWMTFVSIVRQYVIRRWFNRSES